MAKKTLEEKYLNYNPEEDPNGSQGIELADEIIDKYGSIENFLKFNKRDKGVKSIEKENDLEKNIENNSEKEHIFIKRAYDMQINPNNLFINRADKEKLIIDYKGNKGYFSKLSDYQIGMVFRRLYDSAVKKSKK